MLFARNLYFCPRAIALTNICMLACLMSEGVGLGLVVEGGGGVPALDITTPCATFRQVAVSLRGLAWPSHLFFPSLCFVGCCGLCSYLCRFCVVGVPGLCCLRRVPFVHWRCPVVGLPGLCWLLRDRLTMFAAHAPPLCGHPPPASPHFHVHEAQVPHSSMCCTGRPPPALHHSMGSSARMARSLMRVVCASRVACAPLWLIRVACAPVWCPG